MAQEADTKTRIIEAAGPIFAEKGFEGATAREICDAAGVNVAAVNYYFGSKENLYAEVVRSAMPVLAEDFTTVASDAGMTPEDKLRLFIRTLVEHMLGRPAPVWKAMLVMREMLSQSSLCREQFIAHIRMNFQALLSILDQLLPPGTPEHRRYQTAFSVISQCVHYRGAAEIIRELVPPDLYASRFTPACIAEHITQFVFASLGLGPTLRDLFQRNDESGSCGEANVKVSGDADSSCGG
ncbi:CerR family C-terminal domain-containing protein [Thermostilla marina]